MYKSLPKLSLTAAALACLPLTACFDDNYDLSDIDTTAEIKVNDLVVPVNLDEITLSNVFDLDEESVVKEIDGAYAVLVDGDFKSDEIHINSVSLAKPVIPATTTSITLLDNTGGVTLPPVSSTEMTLTYEVTSFNTSFTYTSANVDKSIRSLSKIAVDWSITVDLTVHNQGNAFNSVAFRDLSLKIPAGLHLSNYNNENGIVKLSDINLSAGNMTHSVVLRVDAVDFSKLTPAEYSFVTDPNFNQPGTLTINGSIGAVGGYVVAITNKNLTNLPAQTSLTLAPKGTDIIVKSVDGSIRYAINDFNVEPVQLNDLPDLLRQEETNITISNPRLYLAINNPMAGYSLDATSGLTLTACREDGSRKPYSLDAGQFINIGYDKGITGPYTFCLAPDPTAAGSIDGFSNPSPVRYQGLGNVLSGNGLPNTIEVAFDNPHVGPGEVEGFTVPQTLDKIEGRYSFYAPLNLGVGSKIVYDEVTDGWNDDTVEKITIEKLKVNASVTNSLPFDIVLSGYPVDAEGNQCKDVKTGAPVSLGSVTVKAGETSPFNLESTGTIKGVDGIRYYATGVVSKADVTLRPDATIKLSGIKATVSGFYIDEL